MTPARPTHGRDRPIVGVFKGGNQCIRNPDLWVVHGFAVLRCARRRLEEEDLQHVAELACACVCAFAPPNWLDPFPV